MFIIEKARRMIDAKKADKGVGREPAVEYYYVVCQKYSVEYTISRWARMLPLMGANKPHIYISIVVRFCNFLQERKKKYYEATTKDIRDFFERTVFFDKKGKYSEYPQIQATTVSLYEKSLIHFYKYLNDFYDSGIIKTVVIASDIKTVEVFGEVKTRWEDIRKEAQTCINYSISNYKTNDRVYIKEYSDEELVGLYYSFKTLMNKAIFFLTLKGMRIDEVLSIKIADYDSKMMTVQPSRSKGRKRKKSDIRTIVIGPEGVQLVELYLFHERNPALHKILKEKRKDSDYLFVTLRKNDGEIPFTPYTQESFRSALKNAAKNVGIETGVRTHSGRSHRAIELARLQHQGVITDVQINLIMGWKSNESHQPYNNHVYKEEAEKILENVHSARSVRKHIAQLDALIKEGEVDSEK